MDRLALPEDWTEKHYANKSSFHANTKTVGSKHACHSKWLPSSINAIYNDIGLTIT